MSAATVTEFAPGIYADVSEETYHAHHALSASGAKKLLPPSCPAIFHYERTHGQKHKREFDLGHAAHQLVLGVGPELHVVGGDNFKTKAVQTERDEAYARGDVPLTPEDYDTVQAMASALRAHPRAGELFTGGVAEQSLFWTDPETGVACRARLDYLSDKIVDYKTSTSAAPSHISKAVANYSYHVQAAHYLDGAIELDLLPEDAEFLFVFQDKAPPYLVTVIDLDEPALRIGREQMRFAMEIFRDCTEADIWPGYSDDIETISLPSWYARAHTKETW